VGPRKQRTEVGLCEGMHLFLKWWAGAEGCGAKGGAGACAAI
jgi:hypothetical protein